MKKKTRNITVDGVDFRYWYSLSDECTSLFVSPAGDKTIRVCYRFLNETGVNHWDGAFFWKLTRIEAVKDGTPVTVKLLEPGFVSALIRISLKENPGLFSMRRKETIYSDAYRFVKTMGYTDLQPKWQAGLW